MPALAKTGRGPGLGVPAPLREGGRRCARMTARVAVRTSDDAIIPSRGQKAWNSTIDLAVDLDQCNYERRCQTVRIPSKWSGMSSAARISSIDAPRHGPTRNRRDSIIMQAMTHVTDRQPLSARWGQSPRRTQAIYDDIGHRDQEQATERPCLRRGCGQPSAIRWHDR